LISGIEDRISCKRCAVIVSSSITAFRLKSFGYSSYRNRSERVGTTAPVELILDRIEQPAMSGFREAGDILWL
jgi:hypothetical protein